MRAEDRKEAFDRARLYLVAPGELPTDVLEAVIENGVDVVQLRMKDAEAAEIIEIGDAWMHMCHDAGVPFVVNDRPDIALALGADGVHLGQDDLPPSVAREICGPDIVIGRSTHSTDDIASALHEYERGLADYIAVGPIGETPTKPGRPAVGLDLVRYASANVPVGLPWFGIGAIDASNIDDTVTAGASRVVVVRAITEADDPVASAASLREALPS